jgi:hypothetical protein
MLGSSWVAAQLAAFQEGLSSMSDDEGIMSKLVVTGKRSEFVMPENRMGKEGLFRKTVWSSKGDFPRSRRGLQEKMWGDRNIENDREKEEANFLSVLEN